MVASKGGRGGGAGDGGTSVASIIQPITSACCMCGDYGLSYELFRCKICQFRSQHKYCSNQYPKADSYKACNWCLTQKHDSVNSSYSLSSLKNNSGDERRDHAVKTKRNPSDLRERRRAPEMQLTKSAPIKKLHGSSPEDESPVSSGRKKISDGVLRKSKSANQIAIAGGGGGIKTRQVFRNKGRRYKLLDEVSSQ